MRNLIREMIEEKKMDYTDKWRSNLPINWTLVSFRDVCK